MHGLSIRKKRSILGFEKSCVVECVKTHRLGSVGFLADLNYPVQVWIRGVKGLTL